jgi:hypothetical protein
MINPVSIGKLIENVVLTMTVPPLTINFEIGTVDQVIGELIKKDSSKTYKDKKYPLIALFTPVEVQKGGEFYGTAFIKRITIAALSVETKLVKDRYGLQGNFETILYPCYKEFLIRLCESGNVSEQEPNKISHRIIEAPGVQPIPDTTDFVDCLHLDNLEFTILQQSKC